MTTAVLEGIITTLLAVLAFLGVDKALLAPRLSAHQLRRRYATALWLACQDLQIHLKDIAHKIGSHDLSSILALKKIPNNDYHGEVAWFVKDGYLATVTAYKLSLVSAWAQIYQQELLLSPYRASRTFLSGLHEHVDALKSALGTGTCLWADYYDAIGSKLISGDDHPPRPITFAAFCDRYFGDQAFRQYYEQLHMFIWFVADDRHPLALPAADKALGALIQFLRRRNLLRGMHVRRPTIVPSAATMPTR